MIIIVTIVLSSSFLTSAENILVKTVEIETVEKKSGTGDKLSDDSLDFTLPSSHSFNMYDLNTNYNYIAPYNPYETNLAPFRPPRFFLTA